jgi:hypothetical protein
MVQGKGSVSSSNPPILQSILLPIHYHPISSSIQLSLPTFTFMTDCVLSLLHMIMQSQLSPGMHGILVTTSQNFENRAQIEIADVLTEVGWW